MLAFCEKSLYEPDALNHDFVRLKREKMARFSYIKCSLSFKSLVRGVLFISLGLNLMLLPFDAKGRIITEEKIS
jgi:hypothetical protein